jgi:ABC-type cobalamin/Fe3+-siderophores transport system ATPase subunit
MTGNHIIIRDLKGIKYMDFEIPNKGVHVITASNGSGKTTLIVCLSKLKNSRAFSDNFVQHNSWNVDSYRKTKITYKSRLNNSVTYTYRSESKSWRATTRTTSAINEFGYDEIIVIPTLGKRVYVQDKTIKGGKVRAASDEIRSAMSSILENPKFNTLLKLNLGETRGRGGKKRRKNTAFILPKGRERNRRGQRVQTYYSESSFSLGEIFTLNLLYQVNVISNNSLLVIDELEVALHPRVQINLLNYLKRKSDEKNLTVILSTHSSSLIKCASNLIYLDRDNAGTVAVHYNCYPTLALQEVAVEEDIQPDYVFFVEDSAAESLLREMIKTYFKLSPEKQQPIWKILPIGGYPEVLRFTKKSNQYLFHRKIGQYAFLDQDVFVTRNDLRQLGNTRTPSQNQLLDLFESQDRKVKFLEITPELGLWNWLHNHFQDAEPLIRVRFPDALINLQDIINECNLAFPHVAQNPRNEAKNKISWIIERIENLTNEAKRRIKQHFFGAYSENFYQVQINQNKLKSTFGQIFNKQGN